MPRVTIKELEEKVSQANRIIDLQQKAIEKLTNELEETRKGLNVVSNDEFKGVLSDLENTRERYRVLEEQKNKDTARLKEKVDMLITKIEELEKNSSEIKTEHNSRGAGRKEFQDYETVKNIFNLYADGESLQGIANKLNESNIKTRVGGAWAKSSVRFILLNKSYVEKGIIDEEMFSNITERMKRK